MELSALHSSDRLFKLNASEGKVICTIKGCKRERRLTVMRRKSNTASDGCSRKGTKGKSQCSYPNLIRYVHLPDSWQRKNKHENTQRRLDEHEEQLIMLLLLMCLWYTLSLLSLRCSICVSIHTHMWVWCLNKWLFSKDGTQQNPETKLFNKEM